MITTHMFFRSKIVLEFEKKKHFFLLFKKREKRSLILILSSMSSTFGTLLERETLVAYFVKCIDTSIICIL